MRGAFDITASVSEFDPNEQTNELQAFNGLLQTIAATIQTIMPLVQAQVLPKDTINNFVRKAFELWRQDSRRLIGPLSSLANPIASQQNIAAQGPANPEEEMPSAGEDVQAASINGQGFGGGFQGMSGGLAGTGPRPGAGQIVEE